MIARRPTVVLIAGPTASGKSALALRLAERIGGTLINADSMQVYRDLRVLTARPDAADEARAPHRLYGTIDGATAWSVSRWLEAAVVAIAAARASGSMPIVVGGTGLYFKALTQGLSAIPPIPDHVRDAVRRLAETEPPDALHRRLTEKDPVTAARLRPTDPQRITRALEVFEATGRGLSTFHDAREPPAVDMRDAFAVRLAPDRVALHAAIDARFAAMVREGALAEVEALVARALAPTLPVMRTLGVAPLAEHLAGRSTLAHAVARAQGDTRRYVRRQDTFARHQLPGFEAVAPAGADALLAQLSS